MNDDTLTAALDRMASALEPPVAADRLVHDRRSQLRRRRRVAAGLTAVGVFAIIATGGVLASGLGNADPARGNGLMASTSPAPSEAVDEETLAPDIEENDGDWHCATETLTPAEIEAFRKDFIDEAQLSLDVVDEKIRAYLILGDKSDAVYELEARRVAGTGDVEILAITRCGD